MAMESSGRASLLRGSTEPRLLDITLGQLLANQCEHYGNKVAVICPSSNSRTTYTQLQERSKATAKGLLSCGITRGDIVAVLAGNRIEYVDLLFATARVGAILAVINNSYTPSELENALRYSDCKVLFTSEMVGGKHNPAIKDLLIQSTKHDSLPLLKEMVLFQSENPSAHKRFRAYSDMIEQGRTIPDHMLQRVETSVHWHDVCNLQYTSGTTGNPKAAMLTHYNIINNARFIGDRMGLRTSDILCCPPPLFHCFGLVLGLLAVITRAGTVVFPSESFDAAAVLRALRAENCTALHGVPAMWTAEMQLLRENDHFNNLRTGIAAGSATPRQMMEDLQAKLNLSELTNTYGMTETSPASFMTSHDDPLERRLSTVGRILPHVIAKIIDSRGRIVPLGTKGELCVSGYLLQKGYFKNPQKTAEVMVRDEKGILWMHTGDEASFDEQGYCKITGRIKDMIIRGGENIFPLEIEERLVQHPEIATAAVVGLKDHKYGEVVAAFLDAKRPGGRVSDEEIRSWVRSKLARYKTPQHIFWVGDSGVGDYLPLTGSGKIKKNVLRDIGDSILFSRKWTKTTLARL